MHNPLPPGMPRSERILSEKLTLLYRNAAAAVTNAVVGGVVCVLYWDAFPHALLIGWIILVSTACAVRFRLRQNFFAKKPEDRCTVCAARRFALGAGVSGLLWGALCFALPVWGDPFDFIVMTVACAGMTAGALTTVSIYYPAYLAYTGTFAIPLVFVTLTRPDGDIAGTGAMMIVYFAAISITAYYANRFIHRTMELSVDNQILKASLDETTVERDAARIDKWSMLTQLSHEVKTPLNAILGFAEAMAGEIFGSLGHARYKEYAVHVLSSGQHLSTLADELLLLSEGEAGVLELNESNVDVTALLRALIETKKAGAMKAGLSLAARIDSDLPNLKADRIKLYKMLANLIDNSVKFTPPGGHIFITAETRAAGTVHLAVSDTGIGMRREDIALALQPFGRVAAPDIHKTAGAGLGLPICRRLAELHGATLAVQSKLEEGTTCTIAFPAGRSIMPAARAFENIAAA